MKITKAPEIKLLKPEKKQKNYSWGGGLQVVVESESKGGGKYFAGRMRFQGKQRTVYIGSTKEWKLTTAKTKFEEIKHWSKANDKEPREFGIQSTQDLSNGKTLGSLFDSYLKYKTDVKPITLRNYRNQINQVLMVIPASTPIKEMEWDGPGRKKVMELKAIIESRGSYDQADRTQKLLHRVFNYAISQSWFHRRQNPAIKYEGEINKHAPKKKHNPTITWDQVPQFLQDVNENRCKGGIITDLAVKTLLMTFLRVGALCRMEWDWYEEQSDCWIIPGDTPGLKRRKDVNEDTPHHIPVTEPLRELMNVLRRYTGHQKYVFWSFRGKQYPHLSLDAPNNHLKNLGYKGLLTAHGWRSLPMTAGQDVLSFPPELIQRQMAHLLKDKTRDAYDNSTLLDERRKFMDAWCNALLQNGLRI